MSGRDWQPDDIEWMRQALELAQRGLGAVEPNPAVGCVIVKDGRCIGAGWHKRFGSAHAEIEALSDCRAKGFEPAGATMYVSLEPCCHFGKTPPCTQAIIAAGIKKLFAACQDPSAKVAGKGLAQLQAAGIETHCGLLASQAEALNAPFFKFHRTGMPYVYLKWAQSLDGKLAWKNPSAVRRWISNPASRADVHRLRSRVQAILTGIGTVLADNPQLTVRLADQPPIRPPLRVVLDSRLRLPWDCHLISTDLAPTLVITTHTTYQTEADKAAKLQNAGVAVAAVAAQDGRCSLTETLALLAQRDIQAVLVEAGPTLIGQFLAQRLADELWVYVAPMLMGNAGQADLCAVLEELPTAAELTDVDVRVLDGDIRLVGKMRQPSDKGGM